MRGLSRNIARLCLRVSLFSALGALTAAQASVPLEAVGEIKRPLNPECLSGISPLGTNTYLCVNDRGGELWTMNFALDPKTGMGREPTFPRKVILEGATDLEDCAVDPLMPDTVWACDETDTSICAFSIETGVFRKKAELPAIYTNNVANLAIEAMTISADGLSLWFCNEETLACDGNKSSSKAGSRVRLTQMTRASAAEPWRFANMWVYETDPIGAHRVMGKSLSGVSGLAVTPSGSLLVLEREFSGIPFPRFRCRIYEINPLIEKGIYGLAETPLPAQVPILPKTRVFDSLTGMSMYEGICLGPRLANGLQTYLLIADGGDVAQETLLVLREVR